MDDLLIKTNTVNNGVTPASGASDGLTGLAGLAVSFQDLLHKAGARIENGFFAIVDRAGISAMSERSEPANPSDDYRRRQPDDGNDRYEGRDRADENRSDQSRARPVDREDDYGRDHGADHRDARGDDAGSDHGDSHADDRAGERPENSAANDQAPAKDENTGNDKAKSGDGADKTASKAKQSNGDAKTAGNQAGGQNGKGVVANADAAVVQAGVAQQLLNPLLAGLLAAGDVKGGAEGQVQAVENVSATGSENMAQTALENVTKVTPVAAGKDSGPQDNHKAQAQAFANAANQAKAVAADQSAVNVETGTASDLKPIETQAASLAKVFGDGNKAQVSVTVTNEAQILTSKPTASLTSGAVLATDGASQSSGQNANTHAQANAQNPVAAAQALQAQGGPAQSQGAQNSQGLTTAQAHTDAKGLAQAANATSNSGGTAHSGSGEAGAQANAGNVSASQQTQQAQQQAQADKAHNTEKPSRPGHSVVEQVFVKITKAINAGNDKITIQLRPANMGRVEVKMELTHDNRLTAVVTVDNKDTLEALQRDAKELQKALHDAGLHTGNGDLNFNLRGQTGQGTDGDGKSAGKLFGEDVAEADEAAVETALLAPRDGIYVNGRIDVRV